MPYRDIVQAGRDLAENRIQFLSSSFAVVRPLVEAGKVRVVALGVRQRNKLLPDVPSRRGWLSELAIDTTSGFYGPRGMPLELRKRIAADIVAAANDPTISERIAATGQDMVPAGPEELAATLKQLNRAGGGGGKDLGLQRKN